MKKYVSDHMFSTILSFVLFFVFYIFLKYYIRTDYTPFGIKNAESNVAF